MKTGRIGKLTVAMGICLLLLFLFQANIIGSLYSPSLSSFFPKLEKNQMATSTIPNFSAIKDVAKKKQAFFNFLTPSVLHQNELIKDERLFLIESKQQLLQQKTLLDAEKYRIESLFNKYQFAAKHISIKTLDELLVRVDTIPIEMVLIQAANETGWGSSRFAREGLNFFGQWCFSKGCGLVPQSRSSGLSHEVAKFDTVEDSVASYMRNINTNAAYRLLRSIRADLRKQDLTPKASELVYGLLNYSERQEAYIDELLVMLEQNQQYLAKIYETHPH